MSFKVVKEKKGITLIALVITIIVLLILAGISINMLTGQNGILNRAQEAKEMTEIAGEEELRKLTQMQAAMNLENTTFTDNSTGEEKTVTIPAGFAVSQVEGENTLKNGLVIIDTNGNEFVWIEVPKNITNEATNSDEILSALNNYAIDYRLADNNTDEWYDGCGLTEDEFNARKDKMLYSIKDNGGFWIGRYESGSEINRKSSSDDLTKMFIQRDKYPYNFVTVEQAQHLANQLSTNQYYCSLMFDIQWDLAFKFLEEKGLKTQEEIKENSASWGNFNGNEEQEAIFSIKRGKYSLDDGLSFNKVEGTYTKQNTVSVLLTTGASERNKVSNIYDLAGNVAEWELGKIISNNPCLYRGGSYKAIGLTVAGRPNASIDTSLSNIGFRITMY